MKSLIGQITRSAALLLAVACGSDSTGPAQVSVVGVYQVKTINGAGLPFLFSQTTTTKIEVTGDQITLNADHTFSDIESARVTQGSSVTNSQAGSIGVYQATNGQVQFTETSPTTGTFNGSVSGNTLTIIYPSGNTFVYGR